MCCVCVLWESERFVSEKCRFVHSGIERVQCWMRERNTTTTSATMGNYYSNSTSFACVLVLVENSKIFVLAALSLSGYTSLSVSLSLFNPKKGTKILQTFARWLNLCAFLLLALRTFVLYTENKKKTQQPERENEREYKMCKVLHATIFSKCTYMEISS